MKYATQGFYFGIQIMVYAFIIPLHILLICCKSNTKKLLMLKK